MKNLEKYLDGEWIESEQSVSQGEREFEFLMLGLRTSAGISKEEFFTRFGVNFDEKYGERVSKFAIMGYFCEENGRISLCSKSLLQRPRTTSFNGSACKSPNEKEVKG